MILINEQLIARNEACIDIEDRAHQFGDGIYEVIRVYNGQAFLMHEHLLRLTRSAAAIKMNLPSADEKLADNLCKLIDTTNLKEGIIYMQVSRGVSARNHSYPANIKPNIIAYTIPKKRPLFDMQHGVAAITTEDIRWLRCDIKSLNLLGAVLAKQNAFEQQATEAIFHRDDNITEGSATNIFMVKNDTIWTHPKNNLILHGITRELVIRLANQLNLIVKEEVFRKDSLLNANECFMTGTTVEITPITSINKNPLGNGNVGPITRKLQQAFEAVITSEVVKLSNSEN